MNFSGQAMHKLVYKAWPEMKSVSGWMDILCFDILISFVNERTVRKRGSTILNTRISIFSFKVFVARSIGMFAHPLYFPSNQFYRSFKGGKVSALLISTFYSSVRISLRKSRDSFTYVHSSLRYRRWKNSFYLPRVCF